MIIITKKLPPRRLAAGCLLGACAVILLGAAFGVVEAVPAAPVSSVAAADGSDIRTNADRVAYLESYGWQVSADPIAVEDIQSIVATLKHKNIGVIITDHNVDETLAITDRTYLLYEGKILKTGTAEELAADPMVRKVYLGQHFELKKSHQLTQQMKNRKGQQAQQAGEETETQE